MSADPLPTSNGRFTIKDVARLAGVSRSTVSRVLTGHAHVSPVARAAVQRVVEQTDYRPSGVARSLVLGQSTLVAMVVPSISNIFYAELVRGVEDALAGAFSLVIVSTEDDPRREQQAFARLHEARVAGLVVSTLRHDAPDRFPGDVPVVFINRAPQEAHHSVVTSDNRRGGYLATALLLEHGHRRIGHVSLNLALPTSGQRHAGYRQAMQEAGIEPLPAWSSSCGLGLEAGIDTGRRLIEQHADVTALFTDSDTQAIGVMEALWQAGLSVPRDLSLVSFDDTAFAALSPFSLTSIRTPRRAMGELAGRLVREAVAAGSPVEPRRIVLPVELIRRRSVGSPRRQVRLTERRRGSEDLERAAGG